MADQDPYAATAEQDPYSATAEGGAARTPMAPGELHRLLNAFPKTYKEKGREAAGKLPLGLQREGVFKQAQAGYAGLGEKIRDAGLKGDIGPFSTALGTFLTGSAADVVGLAGQPTQSTGNALLTIGSLIPVVRAGLAPVFIYQGLRSIFERSHPGETVPDFIQRGLLGGAMVAGGAAQGGQGVREAFTIPPALFRGSLAPTEVPIAGEKVPVLKGEAEPMSRAGRFQQTLKQHGVAAERFEEFSQRQLAAVKQSIRNVAQKVSGMTGPVQDEPAAAMKDAAGATFAAARPMYKALDEALVTVPDAMERVTPIVRQAIKRAAKYGIEPVESGGRSLTIDGRTYTPESDPVAWQNFKDQGLVPSAEGQPLTTYIKIRSELLKMQRGTADAAMRNAIGNEVRDMDANLDGALKDSPLLADWQQANRLWSRGYALREVVKALRQSTKGTPESSQAKQLGKVPTRVQGAQLVKRLNDLANDGVLQKAFSQEEISNLRQAADILDRARARVGTELVLRHTPRSILWGNLLKMPFRPFVKMMTTPEGVYTLGQLLQEDISRGTKGAGVTGVSKTRRRPGQQIRDLQGLTGTNPATPVGPEP